MFLQVTNDKKFQPHQHYRHHKVCTDESIFCGYIIQSLTAVSSTLPLSPQNFKKTIVCQSLKHCSCPFLDSKSSLEASQTVLLSLLRGVRLLELFIFKTLKPCK